MRAAPAPVGEQGARPLNKICPPARGLARHNKRFTIEEIIKIVATRCQILRLKCTKSFVGWSSAPDPAGELTALPQTPSWILYTTSKGGWKGTRREGRGREGRVGERGEGKGKRMDGGGEGAGSAPKLKLAPRTIFLAPALNEKLWGVTSGGLKAGSPTGCRGRAPGQEIWGRIPARSWKLFAAQVQSDFCPTRSLHAKLIASKTNITFRHISCCKLRESVFPIRAGTGYKQLIFKN